MLRLCLRRKQLLLIAGTALVLAGCAGTGGFGPGQSGDGGAERRAQRLSEGQRYDEAAQIYDRLANRGGPSQARYLIEAGRAYLAAGRIGAAQDRLDRTAGLNLGDALRVGRDLLAARVALANGNIAAAESLRAGLPETVPGNLMAEMLEVRGRLAFARGEGAQALQHFVERDTWLANSASILENHRIIWNGLTTLPPDAVLPRTDPDPAVAGWLALAPAARAAANPFELRRELRSWQSLFPRHPAARALVPELEANLRALTDYPQQVALLLPMSGRQQAASGAIRDGFIAAHLQNTGDLKPILRVYDTEMGGDLAYQRAVEDGADFVVGPLLKNRVAEVAPNVRLIPTLTLNYLPAEVFLPSGSALYQFAPAPEHEARAIAETAIANGEFRAIALVAGNDWGFRILREFQRVYEALGGQVVDSRSFDPRTQDFSGSITDLLKINGSAQRHRRLAANLGRTIEFQPRRRKDIDMIFVAANAQAGRLLAPQLRFHFAADLPTYATADIFQPGSRLSNNDLNGIVFPDMPWVVNPELTGLVDLKRTLTRYWPNQSEQLSRLFAFGFDAYRLVAPLNRRDINPIELAGLTGGLTLDPDGRIVRRLTWAQFRQGRPQIWPEPVVEETLETPPPQVRR